MIKYIKTFFDEKIIEPAVFEVESENGTVNIITNECVIEHIKLASVREQKQIANVLRKIDFMNGNVNRFLAHLAGSLAQNL